MTNVVQETTGGLNPSRICPPCILVIFGATGDLTARKLLPALYHLTKEGRLSDQFVCVGFARRAKTHEEFCQEMKQAIMQFSLSELDIKVWERFQERLFYHRSEFDNDEGYKSLKIFLEKLDEKYNTQGNHLFYLSTPPQYFSEIIQSLNKHKLFYHDQEEGKPWSRVIIEKPFGRDLDSAKKLQECINENLHENSVYHIDHYLGKETVQNILTVRFANTIFESCWNSQYIDHVQISLSETIGIGSRGNLFEKSGMLRDMVQNHMMQLLCLLTMEPPSTFDADEIRKEKIKILQRISPFSEGSSIIRGQYGPGTVQGVSVLGYRQEENVDNNSQVETYVALKALINNPRWLGVPFYLRVGKRLAKKSTDISIIFKKSPYNLFSLEECSHCPIENDLLIIRIQPDEGVALKFNCKVPGTNNIVRPVKMDFRYDSYFKTTTPEAYERLLCDCIIGDRTLFTGGDEVMASWKLFTPVLEAWAQDITPSFPNYAAGSSGPKEADILIERDGRSWRSL
ncbi:Glucose-6-phosphate 1-dehydrogenase,glucose-6-phosphate 1-dehydrogenase,glucose-6-phosphate dehydrogenase,Glucose-6-phosphate dehydrogenase, C-terminal domain [Chlamydia serpentis]|uniref:Glucose-6-phosphate 1-dehydrogenase n=2 Tax=Chlamydia serpentis TaxID=1967782 RepID=A0A2R8FAW4_9CHLA|nr:Glucose-6-phosphate 1-dehydrogenase,glucose-6-phosphate 1-dehydrogenase,glucose-6-phosphate dehydrogenase,Glucose-6-phosphate dehydrogenase, C-terminal domain [Chlamydia serpentis]